MTNTLLIIAGLLAQASTVQVIKAPVDASRPSFLSRPAPLGAGGRARAFIPAPGLAEAEGTTKPYILSPDEDGYFRINGVPPIVDLPAVEHMRNSRGIDGQGLCVTTSVQVCGRTSGWDFLAGLQAYARRGPGGADPPKLARFMQAKFPNAKYVSYVGPNPEAVLELAMQTRRPCAMTYGYDPFVYGNRTISHFVALAHLDGRIGAVADNNNPGKLSVMSRAELLKRNLWPHNTSWVVVLLEPPVPPRPKMRVVRHSQEDDEP